MKKTIIFLFIILFAIGCDDENSVEAIAESVVVSAFLYENEKVDDVFLTSTLDLGSTDENAPPISGVDISIFKSGTEYQLIENPQQPGNYIYEGTDLTIDQESDYRIELAYDGTLIWAQTQVPTRPEGVEISNTTVKVPEDFFDIINGDIDEDEITLTVNWENNDDSYFYVVIENIDDDPEEITNEFEGRGPRPFISEPTISNEFRIIGPTLTHYGDHQAIVYKVNQEYVDLYESREQDSRNLNEPLTNINNGLGVFSAFASDTVYFEAKKY